MFCYRGRLYIRVKLFFFFFLFNLFFSPFFFSGVSSLGNENVTNSQSSAFNPFNRGLSAFWGEAGGADHVFVLLPSPVILRWLF